MKWKLERLIFIPISFGLVIGLNAAPKTPTKAETIEYLKSKLVSMDRCPRVGCSYVTDLTVDDDWYITISGMFSYTYKTYNDGTGDKRWATIDQKVNLADVRPYRQFDPSAGDVYILQWGCDEGKRGCIPNNCSSIDSDNKKWLCDFVFKSEDDRTRFRKAFEHLIKLAKRAPKKRKELF